MAWGQLIVYVGGFGISVFGKTPLLRGGVMSRGFMIYMIAGSEYSIDTSREGVQFNCILRPARSDLNANGLRKIVRIIGGFHMRGLCWVFFLLGNWDNDCITR